MKKTAKLTLIDALGRGKDSMKTAKELSWLTGISIRDIGTRVQNLRLGGVPVCSSTGSPAGYWLPDSVEELIDCVESLRRRARTMSSVAEALAATL